MLLKFHLGKGGSVDNDYLKETEGRKDMKKKLTVTAVVAEINKLDDMICRITPEREFRVNFVGGREDTAYYTTNALDAIEIAAQMSASLTSRTKERSTDNESSNQV
jgi:hypothetical protein